MTLWNCHFLLLGRHLFGIWGNSEHKIILQNFKQLIQFSCFLLKKRNVTGLFFFWTGHSVGEFPRDYLINVATCLFSCHQNSNNQQKRIVRFLFLLIMYKEHALNRSINLGRNHTTIGFRLGKEGQPNRVLAR